ncbi:MAG: DUF4956 domain-containing protein [Bacteroidetes bacterium]|nr:MAG: DUF4956 domain-containing protein [Bacteroidota bacterium]
MGVFEPYLEQFSQSVNLTDFLINLAVVALLTLLLRIFFIRHAQAVSNRARFAAIFLPLGLTTMLIITIVKSSIALSLGLVGALSIVRFRAAIKDPEELTYLFLVIGIGLAAGANQPLIALVAFVFILGLLYLSKRFTQHQASPAKGDRMYLHIETDVQDLDRITATLSPHLEYVALQRMDTTESGLILSFVVKAADIAALEKLRQALQGLSPATTLSLVDQPDLVL